jgi:hypothetical protein
MAVRNSSCCGDVLHGPKLLIVGELQFVDHGLDNCALVHGPQISSWTPGGRIWYARFWRLVCLEHAVFVVLTIMGELFSRLGRRGLFQGRSR